MSKINDGGPVLPVVMYGDFGVPFDRDDGKERVGSITYHREIYQGTDEWFAARCGLLTASEMHLILTPTLKVANNDKSRSTSSTARSSIARKAGRSSAGT